MEGKKKKNPISPNFFFRILSIFYTHIEIGEKILKKLTVVYIQKKLTVILGFQNCSFYFFVSHKTNILVFFFFFVQNILVINHSLSKVSNTFSEEKE